MRRQEQSFRVYTRPMRQKTRTIGAIACLSLLTLQLSGAHVHIGPAGYVGVPETSFSHDHGEQDHHHGTHVADAAIDHAAEVSAESDNDYGDAQDVSLLDQTLPAFKIPLAVPAPIALFAFAPRVRSLASTNVVYRVLSGRYTRWRPPLRAPPQPA